MEKLGIHVNIMAENSGTGVGLGSESSAKDLNFWEEKRERESAMVFRKPGPLVPPKNGGDDYWVQFIKGGGGGE